MTVDLADALTDIAHTPAPPTRIDAARARAEGRRRLRRRRAAGIAGIVTGVTAGITALALVVSATPKAPPERGGDRATGSPAPVIDPHRSPLIVAGKFGWLPSYIAAVGYQQGYHGDMIIAQGARSGAMDMPRILLSVYERGTTPPLGEFTGGARQQKVKAPDVNKRPAYWVTADPADPLNGGDIYFRWQATRDRWAEIHAYYLPDTSAMQDVQRVAATATIGDWAVPLPLYITGLPSEFTPSEMTLFRPSPDGKAWSVGMLYDLEPSPLTIAISISPTGSTKIVPPRASGPAGAGACSTSNGLDVCVQPFNGVAPSVTAIGGLDGLLSRITLLGADEHNWTTDVLR